VTGSGSYALLCRLVLGVLWHELARLHVAFVYFGVVLPLLGQVVEGEDRRDGANWHAGAAVDTLHGVNVKLRDLIDARPPVLVTRFFFGWMQSTGQASTHAVSLVPMQGSAMTYVMGHLPISFHGMPVRAEIQAPGQCRALFAGLCEQCQTWDANSACDRSRIFREGEVTDFAGIGEEAVRKEEVCVAGSGTRGGGALGGANTARKTSEDCQSREVMCKKPRGSGAFVIFIRHFWRG
jgi:hypothetical protein